MTQPETREGAFGRKRSLRIALGLTATYLVAEVVGAAFTGSLALWADAGHMLTDVGGLALAPVAIGVAERPATTRRTYGFYRVEILAALINAVVLIGISILILWEAYERFRNPPAVASGWMLGVASIGLVVNIISMRILHAGSGESLNVRGAYFEVVSDMLGSLGVILAAIVMWLTGWYYADPLASAAIGLFILPRTWALLGEATGVLLEGTPAGFDLEGLRRALQALPGVVGLHDLHVWVITSGQNAMSVHVVANAGDGRDDLLARVHHCCRVQFSLAHVTVQIESPGWEKDETHL